MGQKQAQVDLDGILEVIYADLLLSHWQKQVEGAGDISRGVQGWKQSQQYLLSL